ncbi:MAG: 1-deoxy-D-xylulose-5-phosphate reductoisomerase [Candidatus Zixiibacteriota bacterium]
MIPKQIVILGSTGSIGRSTLDVVRRHPGRFVVSALAAHHNATMLVEQYHEFRPSTLCIVDSSQVPILKHRLAGEQVRILEGEEGLIGLTRLPETEIVVNAVVGAAGLRVSLETLRQRKNLALANKESLVAGGPLFPSLIKESGAHVLPIDSEHSAIWQALSAGRVNEIRSLILTASGGPFRQLPIEQFAQITVEQALAHPTWKMGPKITIDSSTLVNKGLEVIEAVTLFGVSVDKVNVLVHPQSVIHSMVEFVDSSVMAQLSQPDMRLPISYALFWPERVQSEFGQVNWRMLKSLTFELADYEKFPLLRLAYEVARTGGTAPAVYNAANEIAVGAFLERRIRFTEITDIVTETVGQVSVLQEPSLEDILRVDEQARDMARRQVENTACC